MNAGNRAKELGLYGIMNAVEDVIVARDILLAKNHRRKTASVPLLNRGQCEDDKACKGRRNRCNSRGYATPFYTNGR